MADANTPRPGDTENNLLRKILSVLGGVASPGDTDAEITAKILLALQTAISAVGVTKAYVDAADNLRVLKAGDTMTGQLTMTLGEKTTNTPVISATETWNNAAVTFTGLFHNMTSTASATASLLFDFQFNSTTVLNLRKDGKLSLTGRISIGATVSPASALFYTDANTNTGVVIETRNRNTSGTAAAGLGVASDSNIDSTTTANRLASRQLTEWVTATDASRTSKFTLSTVLNGSLVSSAVFDYTGITLPIGTKTASAPIINASETWNNAAVTFTGMFLNITNTASNSNSNLYNYQVDGEDRANFTVGGTARFVRHTADNSGTTVILRKRGQTGNVDGAILADGGLFGITASGWDGSAFFTGASINVFAEETFSGSVGGTRMVFQVTTLGTRNNVDILRLSSAGVRIPTAVPFAIQSGTNQRAGDAVLVGGTKTVNNTTVTANTRVFLTRKTAGGTIGDLTYTLVASTSFTINSASGTDTSTVSYFLVEVP